ncbi:hypothetical protein [Phyllobacterium phragmitis]|uniref:hypothetical protein n=1 Tax=Phyllobacterium phragmitis TaxID=2670329 RepID=UPI0011B270F7|nr:hypothetical protein [Phyllobacterium phragmitis]
MDRIELEPQDEQALRQAMNDDRKLTMDEEYLRVCLSLARDRISKETLVRMTSKNWQDAEKARQEAAELVIGEVLRHVPVACKPARRGHSIGYYPREGED